MATVQAIVYLVDDDPAIRKTVQRGLTRRGFTVEAFDSARSFLEHYSPDQHGCLILDLSMPEMNGLELQQELINRDITIPIIFITGHGGIPESVQALKAGAIDFLEKPFLPETLALRISEAFAQDSAVRSEKKKLEKIRSRFDRLTEREYEICQLLLNNQVNHSSKEIGQTLGISHRTVEQHRSRILEKTHAKSTAELISLASLIKMSSFEFD